MSGKRIEKGSRVFLVAVKGQMIGAQGVHHDNDDVGALGRLFAARWENGAQSEHGQQKLVFFHASIIRACGQGFNGRAGRSI